MREIDPIDPKGLVRESYRIEGISYEECRSIFLDWALSLAEGQDAREAIEALHQKYGVEAADHPMTKVLTEGLEATMQPKRRGGWRGRTR